jgi:hypothetical protein
VVIALHRVYWKPSGISDATDTTTGSEGNADCASQIPSLSRITALAHPGVVILGSAALWSKPRSRHPTAPPWGTTSGLGLRSGAAGYV